jgi:hypothetical protein
MALSGTVDSGELGFTGDAWDVSVPGFFLPADWSDGVRVSTSWDTAILANQDDGEARRARIGRPTRLVQASVLSYNRDNLSKLLGLIQRSGYSRFLSPLYPDQVRPDQPYSSVTFSVDVVEDLDFYRFAAGQFVVFYNPGDGEFLIERVASIPNNHRLSFSPAVEMVGGIDQNTIILPMIQSRLLLSSKAEALTDRVARARIEGQELPGKWALPPAATPNTVPSGFSTYNGLPVLEIGPNFNSDVEISYTRTGRYSPVGVTQVASVYGERMRQARKFSMLFKERADYWKILSLFDSRAGRTYSWWLPSFTDEYEITEFTANGCKVKSFGPIEDWDVRPYISITLLDGSVEIREIQTVTTNNVVDTLVFADGAFTETDLAEVARSGFAQNVRFETDEIQENWLTDLSVEVEIRTVEVIAEKTLVLPNLVEITTLGAGQAYTPAVCSGSAPFDTTCVPCGNCNWSSDLANIKLLLDIAEVVPDTTKNGLDSSFGAYLTANSPFEVPFARLDNDYFIFETQIQQASDRFITVKIQYDCLLGEWQWEYTTSTGLPRPSTKFRHCGSCLIFSGSEAPGCNSLIPFGADCWNSPRSGDIEDSWDINNEVDAARGCNGIKGWKDHTSDEYFSTFTGLANTKSAIAFGIRGEWSVDQPIPCPPGMGGACIQCLNSCLATLNCSPDPIDTTTGCIAKFLGAPAVDEGGVIACGNCLVIVTLTEGNDSCCRGDGASCPRAVAFMANDCLFDCDNVSIDDICARRRD